MRKVLILAAVLALPVLAAAQIHLISGYNFGQFLGGGYPSMDGTTFDPVGSIGSNFRLATQAPLSSDGATVGNTGAAGNYSNGFGRIYWDGSNGSTVYDFAGGVEIFAKDVGLNATNGQTVENYTIAAQGDSLTLGLTTAKVNGGIAFVQDTTGYNDYDPTAFPDANNVNDGNMTFAAEVSAPVTVSWYLNGSSTPFTTTTLSGTGMQVYSVDLPPGFYGLAAAKLVAKFSNTATIDNIQFNGFFGTPPASGLTFWKGSDGTWSAATGLKNWREAVGGTEEGVWKGGVATFGGTGGEVDVDDADGAVKFDGLKFVATGYTIKGDALTMDTADTPVAVGAGLSATISAIISGGGGLNKTEGGTLILSGVNTYTGGTTVTAGTLNVATGGSIGATTVKEGGTLTGAGTAGAVTVENGGTLAAGTGPTFTMGNLTLGTSSVLSVRLGAAGNTTGFFTVNGNLVLNGTLNASITTGFGNGLYRIIDYTGTLSGSGLTIGAVPGATTDYTVNTLTANQVNLLVNSTSLFWAGGPGNWSTGGTGWNNAGGTGVVWSPSFAIFNGATGTVNVDAGGVTFSGAQFVTDNYTIAGGALNTTTPDTSVRVDAGRTATIASAITGSGGINKRDTGTLILTGAASHGGGTTVSEGTLQIGNGGATGSVGGAITNNAAVVFNLSGTPTHAGAISGSGSVTKQGTGTLALTGANTYTGGTTVSAGTLQIGASGTSGSIVGNITNSATVAFNRSDAVTYAGVISGSGSVTKLGSGTLSLTGANLHEGGTTVTAGTLSIGAGGTSGSLVGNIANSATVAFNRSDAMTYAGVISGAGAVTKLGSGTTTLTGASTYNGATTVSAGKLLINGNQTQATGAVTVQSGGTLGGTGSTGGAVTVQSGGTLAGQSGSALTMASLVLNDGSNVDVTLGAPSNTRLFNVLGALTLGGSLNITAGTGFAEGTYRLFDYGGTLATTGTLAIGTVPGLKSAYEVKTNTAKQVNLTVASSSLPYWTGESTVWSVNPADGGWGSDDEGADAGGWQPGRAIFKGDGTTITVDTTDGAVVIKGVEFHGDGFAVEGDDLTNDTANAPFQVGIIGASADAGFVAHISSDIVGKGGIEKTGPGTLVLSGTNTYTNGTRITGGVLEVSADTALGAATGTNSGIRLNGGTLRAGASLTSARSVTVSGTTSAVDTGANNVALTGVISGSGALTKRGTGNLTVSGANTHTGLTTIAEGALIMAAGQGSTTGTSLGSTTINGGARLAGVGTIRGNLTNGGTVSPGSSPGTITIVGNYTQSAGGTYVAELSSATSYDKLVINGTATLNGTLNVVGLGSFVPGTGQTFKVIEATGGLSGKFASVISPWSNLGIMRRFDVNYGTNDVSLGLTQLPFAGISGATPNQQAIGGAVDGALADGEITTLTGKMNAFTTKTAVLAALDQLSPQRYERWYEQGVYAAAATIRLAESHLGTRADAAARKTDREPQGGLWMEMLRRETRSDEAPAEGSPRARNTSDGIVVGGDIPFGQRWQGGVLFGYTNDNLELDGAGSTTSGERFTAALYTRMNARVFFEALAGMNYAKLDSRRTVALGTTSSVAESKVDSGERYVGLRAGVPFRLGSGRFTPYFGLNYVRWSADEAVESGAGDANLTLANQSADSLTSRAGFSLVWPFAGKKITVTPRLDLAWWHEYRADPRLISASLGGTSFDVQGRSPSENGITAGLGLDATFGSRFSLYARLASEWATIVDESLEARAGMDYRF